MRTTISEDQGEGKGCLGRRTTNVKIGGRRQTALGRQSSKEGEGRGHLDVRMTIIRRGRNGARRISDSFEYNLKSLLLDNIVKLNRKIISKHKYI